MKDKFFLFLEEVGEKINQDIDNKKRFLIITHIDADGLSSATLLLHYLYYNDAEAHLIYAKQLDESFIKNLYSSYPEDIFVFLDLGSGLVDKIKKYAKKETFIFDHHDLVSKERTIDKIYQINPRIFGIDGSKEISTSGIIYYFLKKQDHDFHEISFLGLVGALGDMQENDELIGLNKEMLKELEELDIVEVKKGLKLFGLTSKPLYKALEYSVEVFIPEVTGNEEKAIEFLHKLKISLKKGGGFTTYLDLSEEEEKKLISEIIKLRLKYNIPNAEKIIGNLYITKTSEFYFRELREIAYIFNAMGRMDKPSKAIAFFLGDKRYLEDIQDILIEYKKALLNTLSKIYSGEITILRKGGLSIIDLSRYNVKDTLVSPIATIISNSNLIKDRLLVVFSKQDNKYYKLSVRLIGKIYTRSLSQIVRQAAEKVGGSGGGHDVAAGAIIPKDKLEEFLKNLRILARQESILI